MQGDLFARWYITTPPGASHQVLMWGTRVMAQGGPATIAIAVRETPLDPQRTTGQQRDDGPQSTAAPLARP